jgi:SET domain-containing protein
VFAVAPLEPEEEVIDYGGEIVEWEELQRRHEEREPGHTFLFDLGDGWVIDGGSNGNAARWINHGCEPNVEAVIDGRRVVITAVRPIQPEEELLLDYRLTIDTEPTDEDRERYACACGSPTCRGTMLAS